MSFSRLCDLFISSFWNSGGLRDPNGAFKCNWFSDYTYSGVKFPSQSTAVIFSPQIAFVSAFCCKLLLGVSDSILIYDTDSFCWAFNLLCDCILLVILTYCATVISRCIAINATSAYILSSIYIFIKNVLDTSFPVENKPVLKFFPAFLTNDTVNTIFVDTVQVVLFILRSQSKVKVKMKFVFCECGYSHLHIEEICQHS